MPENAFFSKWLLTNRLTRTSITLKELFFVPYFYNKKKLKKKLMTVKEKNWDPILCITNPFLTIS